MEKSTKRYQPDMEEGKFYHVYNRGNNSDKIFFNEDNYEFFLRRYFEYIPESAYTYAYCLLPNHFHMLIRVKEKQHSSFPPDALQHPSPLDALHLKDAMRLKAKEQSVTHAFHRLFTSYSKAINKQQNRHGSLIENPFKRIEIDSEDYLMNLVLYIHTNPQLHGFEKDYRNYKWSSFNEIVNENDSNIQCKDVIGWFEDIENYKFCHNEKIDLVKLNSLSFD